MAKGRHRAPTNPIPLRIRWYAFKNHWYFFSPVGRKVTQLQRAIRSKRAAR